MTLMESNPKLDTKTLQNLLSNYKGQRILCIGDIMLDRFVYGDVERTSREAPIPILVHKRQNEMLGGAGNAAANLHSLGANVTMIGMVGKDEAATAVHNLCKETLGGDNGLVCDPDRSTVEKTRFVSNNQQIFRMDIEPKTPAPKKTTQLAIDIVNQKIKDTDGILLSDYGNGFLTKDLCQTVIKIANENNVPVLVDPRGLDFSKYDGATIVKPNQLELETFTNMPAESQEQTEEAMQSLLDKTNIYSVITTRGPHGMSTLERDGTLHHVLVKAKEVYDVSGAGDTVGATILMATVAGADRKQAAYLGNIAGSLVVAKIGTAVLRVQEIEDEMFNLATNGKHSETHTVPGLKKLYSAEEALEKINLLKAKNQTIGFTNGYFDLIHMGHVSLINQAKEQCDYLILALNSDQSTKATKGKETIQDEMARAATLGALSDVDMIILFDQETPDHLLKTLQPDLFIKGNNFNENEIAEAKTVQSYGGKIHLVDIQNGSSNPIKQVI